MGQLIQFEDRAVARLREQLGVVEEANEDLIAFARGHSHAVASIHAAALAAIEARSIDSLLAAVTSDWPDILGIDAAAVGLVVGRHGFRADSVGIERLEGAIVEQMIANSPPVFVHGVDCGHPLFGLAGVKAIRAEALIRIDSAPPFPKGLIVLGQRDGLAIDSNQGSQLLLFLGRVVGTVIRRIVASS